LIDGILTVSVFFIVFVVFFAFVAPVAFIGNRFIFIKDEVIVQRVETLLLVPIAFVILEALLISIMVMVVV
jgi:hypothetical protein